MEDVPRATVLITGRSGFLGPEIVEGMKDCRHVIERASARPRHRKAGAGLDRRAPVAASGGRR